MFDNKCYALGFCCEPAMRNIFPGHQSWDQEFGYLGVLRRATLTSLGCSLAPSWKGLVRLKLGLAAGIA